MPWRSSKRSRSRPPKPQALVIGCDQVLAFEGRLIEKSADLAEARKLLRELRGKPHELLTACVLAKGGAPVWRRLERCTLWMRPFSDAFLDEYLRAEGDKLLASVGCYHLEGRGAQLFERRGRRLFFGARIAADSPLGGVARARDYGAMNITGTAKLAGVVGWPVAHSLSPRLHGYWIEQYGIDAAYVPLAVRPEDFAAVINGLRLAGFRGRQCHGAAQGGGVRAGGSLRCRRRNRRRGEHSAFHKRRHRSPQLGCGGAGRSLERKSWRWQRSRAGRP